MDTQLVVPAGQASYQNAFSRDSGDSHPTVVNIELRQAWDGAWYPLVAQEGEPSFASHYVDSVDSHPAGTAGCCPESLLKGHDR